uniref:Uncharacterized protein n=1 Tax=Trypanosoma vivax (strain Y486) TaxID=1055687 RepID=G0TRT0_TRYVY|nr:hypothetical protein TVY486_0200640 [Trypanosoma vivax Y486]
MYRSVHRVAYGCCKLEHYRELEQGTHSGGGDGKRPSLALGYADHITNDCNSNYKCFACTIHCAHVYGSNKARSSASFKALLTFSRFVLFPAPLHYKCSYLTTFFFSSFFRFLVIRVCCPLPCVSCFFLFVVVVALAVTRGAVKTRREGVKR